MVVVVVTRLQTVLFDDNNNHYNKNGLNVCLWLYLLILYPTCICLQIPVEQLSSEKNLQTFFALFFSIYVYMLAVDKNEIFQFENQRFSK